MNIKKYALFLVLLILFFNSGAQNIGQIGDSIKNYTDINGMKQGNWKTLYPNGNLAYEGYFKNDKPLGAFKRYYENGKIQSESFFYENSKYASVMMYNNATRKIASGRYIDKLKDSVWHYYADNGTLILIEQYDAGKMTGESKLYFYPSGELSEVTNYEDGVKHGVYEKYYLDGTLRLRTKYCHGVMCDTLFTYHTNGVKESETPYSNNRRDGVEKNYDDKGRLLSSVPYKEGVCQDPEQAKKESAEVERLLKNKGRYMESSQMQEPLDFLRKMQP